ncbi:PAS domain-containing sensor histidine kinase, partial [bacterium]
MIALSLGLVYITLEYFITILMDGHELCRHLFIFGTLFLFGVYTNYVINRHKNTERELVKAKQTLEKVAHGIADGVLLLSRNLEVIWSNKAISEQTMVNTIDIVGKHCYEVTHHRQNPCEAPHDICPISEVLNSGKPITVMHTHFDRLGNKFFAEVTAYPVKDEDGEIIQFVHVSRDVTGLKKDEDALRYSEERYRSLVESSGDHVYLMSEDLKYIFANTKYLNRMGLSGTQELVGRGYEEFHSLEGVQEFTKRIEKVLIAGEIVSYEYNSQRDGRYFLRTLTPLKDPASGRNTAFTVISKDITEFKEANLRSLLMERLSSIGEIAMGVAHEINNPTSNIMNVIYILLARLRKGQVIKKEEIVGTLSGVEQELERISGITARLLNFASAGTKSRRIVFMEKCILEGLGIRKAFLENRGINIKLELNEEWSILVADAARLEEAFLNLIMNAAYAMQDTQVKELTIKTEIGKNTDGKDIVRVIFTDTGCGIAQSELDKIWKPFYTKRKDKRGTGLGLSNVQGVINEHMGIIKVESQLGKGASFILEFPKIGPKKDIIKMFALRAQEYIYGSLWHDFNNRLVVGGYLEILLMQQLPESARFTCRLLFDNFNLLRKTILKAQSRKDNALE